MKNNTTKLELVSPDIAEKLPLFESIYKQLCNTLFNNPGKDGYHIIDLGNNREYGDYAMIAFRWIYSDKHAVPQMNILWTEDNEYNRDILPNGGWKPAIYTLVPPHGSSTFHGFIRGFVAKMYNHGHKLV